MLTFDLHYHANINCYRFSKPNRNHRLKNHRKYFKKTSINYVASTEHAYKNPLDAYLYLRDTVDTLDVRIIPGVEWISKEGVEIIFLFDSEDSLRQGLGLLKPFSGSVWDVKRLKKETHSITIIPHPFSPGKTGVATILGRKAFLRLLNDVDYVEIHNGLSLVFLNFNCAWKKPLSLMNKMKQIQYTFDLPKQFRPNHIGWAVGSDAHFPGHQFVVGGLDISESQVNAPLPSLRKGLLYNLSCKRVHPHTQYIQNTQGECGCQQKKPIHPPPSQAQEGDFSARMLKSENHWFELLAKRVRFTPVSISPLSQSNLKKCRNLSMNGRCAMSEAIFKNVVGATVNLEKRVGNVIRRFG